MLLGFFLLLIGLALGFSFRVPARGRDGRRWRRWRRWREERRGSRGSRGSSSATAATAQKNTVNSGFRVRGAAPRGRANGRSRWEEPRPQGVEFQRGDALAPIQQCADLIGGRDGML